MTKNNHSFLPTGAEYLLRRQSNFKKRDEIAEKHPIICPREGLKDGIGKKASPLIETPENRSKPLPQSAPDFLCFGFLFYFTIARMASLGLAPTSFFTSCPSLKTQMVGMDITPN